MACGLFTRGVPEPQGIVEVEPPAKTSNCKLWSNRQSYAATWQMQTRSDSAICQITLVIEQQAGLQELR